MFTVSQQSWTMLRPLQSFSHMLVTSVSNTIRQLALKKNSFIPEENLVWYFSGNCLFLSQAHRIGLVSSQMEIYLAAYIHILMFILLQHSDYYDQLFNYKNVIQLELNPSYNRHQDTIHCRTIYVKTQEKYTVPLMSLIRLLIMQCQLLINSSGSI